MLFNFCRDIESVGFFSISYGIKKWYTIRHTHGLTWLNFSKFMQRSQQDSQGSLDFFRSIKFIKVYIHTLIFLIMFLL